MWIAFAILVGIPMALLAGMVVRRSRRTRRRAELMHSPFPQEWRQILDKGMPLYRRMPDDLREQLHGLILVFLDEKRFEGCRGLQVTDEIRLTIAAQACMLLLNRKPTFYPRLGTIYIYPHAYVANEVESDGIIQIEGKSVRLGESWQSGPVVLVWDDVLGGIRNARDGHNVVLHEFSHQLDQENGSADGAPILAGGSGYQSWAQVLGEEYRALQSRSQRGRRSVLDDYGATDPAEFFAVATETFFEKPRQMHIKHPELYEQFKEFYRVDPLEWQN